MPVEAAVTLNLLDESFHPSDTRSYGLAVVLDSDRISACVLDFVRNRFLGVVQAEASGDPAAMTPGHYGHLLEAFFMALPWLKNPFKMVKVAWAGQRSTLIPASLFREEDAQLYLDFGFPKEPDERTGADLLEPVGAWNVFGVPGPVSEAAAVAFPGTRIVHLSSLLIESVWNSCRTRVAGRQLFLHMRPGCIDLVMFDGRRLEYFNTFACVNAEEAAYYLIFVMEQLEADPGEVPVILSGGATPFQDLHELLGSYVANLTTARRNDAYAYSPVFARLREEENYPLMNSFSCAL